MHVMAIIRHDLGSHRCGGRFPGKMGIGMIMEFGDIWNIYMH